MAERSTELGDDRGTSCPYGGHAGTGVRLGTAIIRYMPGVMLTLVNTVSTEHRKFLGRCYECHLALQVRRPGLDGTELHAS